ncbi:uncharacterized protein LOC130620063 [Hydractinia symbiolongicarpus]|uniref:uncharacterized protein LOC130620063 n=1 Tax=Hydractinia symbiolongicarpus TaxID=13093 RepID=UPI00254FE5E5|nr:uncharacterized protein LOC130620063 [Hydractinia symbiolongicarpus]
MAYMAGVGKSTMYRIFVGWLVFLETIFSQLDLKPDDGFLLKKMPDIFVRTGHGLTDLVIDCSGLFFSDIYPGSISDSAITKETAVLEWVRPEHELMSDRGFSVQDHCSIKGVFLNRPAQKDTDQFSPADVAANFDIASTRIHVERFIGRVRDWSILNAVWPLQRMDLRSSTWQVLCHIVNLTMLPIGPKKSNV